MGLIGPACTPRKGFSGRVLIGRGLTHPKTPHQQASHEDTATQRTRIHYPVPEPPTTPPQGEAWTRGFHSVAAAMAAGKRPDPSRTRKLSPPAPMVLPGRPGGRAGHRRTTSESVPRSMLRGTDSFLRCCTGFSAIGLRLHRSRHPKNPIEPAALIDGSSAQADHRLNLNRQGERSYQHQRQPVASGGT